jgi:hypothetical protein
MTKRLKSAEAVALAKAVASKEAQAARQRLRPGSHKVDVTVHISGDLRVAEDTEKASTSAFLSEDVLLLALHYAGCTREAALRIVEQLTTDAMRGWTGSEDDKKAAKEARQAAVAEFDIEGAMRERFAELKRRAPRTPVAGGVQFKGEVEVVERPTAVGEEV